MDAIYYDAIKLKDMKLHEVVSIGVCEVLRVNGGWIYLLDGGNIFVPLSFEFSNKQFLES